MVSVALCQDPIAWDQYVESNPEACNYHRWAWQDVIRKTYAHLPHYLDARDQGGIRGVLPLVFMSSRLFGDCLVSMPFFSYGGILADHSEARDALLEKAVTLAGELGARYVELRQGSAETIPWQS